MSFNSLQFLIFFPIVVAVYYILPYKVRYIWLLASSYYFYMCWNAKYILLIMTSTLVTYGCGLAIGKVKSSRISKWLLVGCLIINLGILFFFKYYNFSCDSLVYVLAKLGANFEPKRFDVLLPVGISFYTFQAIGYTVDVYKKEVEPERNILKYALFVSFFPQLVAGPIERSKNLLSQLSKPTKPEYERMRHGLLIMLWGFFIKVVIADRIAIFVTNVYGNIYEFAGVFLIIATVLFAVEIYCDFAGYTYIAIGAAKVLGIGLMENFDAPYLSGSSAEFWRRWHISLSSWLRDYIYIPLGGNRKGRIRKYLNIIITFFVSGLWHGANWTYVVWGLLNGLYQIVGDIIKPIKVKISSLTQNRVAEFVFKCIGIAITFALIDFSWIFFRANSLTEAGYIIRFIIEIHNWDIFATRRIWAAGLMKRDFIILALSMMVLFIVDVLKINKIDIWDKIEKQSYFIRMPIYFVMVTVILVFGIWGAGYDASGFIYFQF